MTNLTRALGLWALATALACVAVRSAFSLDAGDPRAAEVIASVWSAGEMVGRAVLARPGDRNDALDAALASHPNATLAYETVMGSGPVLRWTSATLAMSFVPGRDGVRATLDGRTTYVTPDEILSHQAYDKGVSIPSVGLSTGVDAEWILAVLAERFGTAAGDVLERASLRRIRVERTVPGEPVAPRVSADTWTDTDARDAALAAARFLTRGVDGQGRFRYMIDAPSNRTLPGYDWPRHAGATYFLAQATALSHDPEMTWATLRAASWLRDHAMGQCGPHRCIGDDAKVDVGSTALAVIAFVEIARTGIDPAYALLVPDLTAFLRSQQRPDGDFMHLYDRNTQRPIDVQLLYYSGEAALALSRAHTLLADPRDLEASKRALARLVGPGWNFFGSRYYFGEEHWTCQVMADLWNRAPDRNALDFCLRWHAYGRKLQFGPGDTPYDADGAYGFGPVITPRLTPVGSRTEAGVATLDAASRAGVSRSDQADLEGQLRRSIAVLLRHQFRPGPRHLFADPAAVEGAMPGSEVDWQLRIDYAQHTGSALVRWLELDRH
ncbi:MAG TPA: hypothetical protein VKU41_13650 [Polyangiaceae bacterium]|nr:hypothetical protein [Polyangiaceae bacterium]